MSDEQEVMVTPGTKVRVTGRVPGPLEGVQWIRDTMERMHLSPWGAEFGLERAITGGGSEVWVEGYVGKVSTPEEIQEFNEQLGLVREPD
jgi:hypothetical protein